MIKWADKKITPKKYAAKILNFDLDNITGYWYETHATSEMTEADKLAIQKQLDVFERRIRKMLSKALGE